MPPNDMTEASNRNRVSARVHDTAEFGLSIHRFGESATLALADAYGDNATIACLSELADRSELRLRDLIERTRLPGPQLVRVIDRLEALGDVARRPGPADGDGRAVIIAITPLGTERAAELERALFSDRDAIDVEVKHSIECLRRLTDDIATQVPTDSFAFDLACLGTALGQTLRSISPSGDISEAMALFTLAITPDGISRPSWVARQVGLTSGSTTKVLDRVESAGYVERSFGLPGDRRGVAVSLTDAGVTLLEHMSEDIAPHARQLLALFLAIADHLRVNSA